MPDAQRTAITSAYRAGLQHGEESAESRAADLREENARLRRELASFETRMSQAEADKLAVERRQGLRPQTKLSLNRDRHPLASALQDHAVGYLRRFRDR